MKKELREVLLNEDLEINDDIHTLANLILNKFSDRWLETGSFFEGPISTRMFSNYTFNKIGDMIENINIGIYFIEKRGKELGRFTMKHQGLYIIDLMLTTDTYFKIQKEIDSYQGEIIDKDERYSFYRWNVEQFESTLVHELIHAYDAYRSKGKFASQQNNDKYQEIQRKSQNAKLKSKLSVDDIDKLTRAHTQYLRLPHEINARFNQQVRNVIKKGINQFDKEFNFTIISFDEFYKKFIDGFIGWDQMTPKIKKNIQKKVYKFYYDLKLEYFRINKGEEGFVEQL